MREEGLARAKGVLVLPPRACAWHWSEVSMMLLSALAHTKQSPTPGCQGQAPLHMSIWAVQPPLGQHLRGTHAEQNQREAGGEAWARGAGGGSHSLWSPTPAQTVPEELQNGRGFGYVVAFRPYGKMIWMLTVLASADACRYVFRNESVRPFSPFEVKVGVFNNKGEGPFSPATVVYSADEGKTPPTPTAECGNRAGAQVRRWGSWDRADPSPSEPCPEGEEWAVEPQRPYPARSLDKRAAPACRVPRAS